MVPRMPIVAVGVLTLTSSVSFDETNLSAPRVKLIAPLATSALPSITNSSILISARSPTAMCERSTSASSAALSAPVRTI